MVPTAFLNIQVLKQKAGSDTPASFFLRCSFMHRLYKCRFVLNPSSNYRQQPYFAYERDMCLDTLCCVYLWLWFFLCVDGKVAPQNTSGRATSARHADSEKPGLVCKELRRNCALAFFKWGLLHVCTHKLFLKILLAYCLRWVLETITSACISHRISITLSFSTSACFCARPLWRVDNACHLPQSTQLPANKPAGVTSASPPLISIHMPAY